MKRAWAIGVAASAAPLNRLQGLTDGLVDGVDVEPQHGAQPGGNRRTEVRDVVDLVLVQADALHQVDLNLVGGGQPADQVGAAHAELLGHRH